MGGTEGTEGTEGREGWEDSPVWEGALDPPCFKNEQDTFGSTRASDTPHIHRNYTGDAAGAKCRQARRAQLK